MYICKHSAQINEKPVTLICHSISAIKVQHPVPPHEAILTTLSARNACLYCHYSLVHLSDNLCYSGILSFWDKNTNQSLWVCSPLTSELHFTFIQGGKHLYFTHNNILYSMFCLFVHSKGRKTVKCEYNMTVHLIHYVDN